MSDPDGLLFAYLLDGTGGGRALSWDEIEAWSPESGMLWIHLDRTGDKARTWVLQQSGVETASAVTLLTAVAHRPRVEPIDDGIIAVIRGVNQNPGDEPDDMVGLHVWIDKHKVITLRRRRVMAGTEIRNDIDAGRGPSSPSQFLVAIAERMVQPIFPIIAELDDRVDHLQSEVIESSNSVLRRDLREVRQQAINLRRYLAPQRDAFMHFLSIHTSWLGDRDRSFLREIADRTARFVEDLDSARERASVTQDELNAALAERMNKTMYLLTIVSALLLPPSLLTGLFGINVGGMPGVETSWAFAAIGIAIPVLAVIEFAVLRRLKWI